MKKVSFFILTIFIFLFSACSTKKVYEPKTISSRWNKIDFMDIDIIDTTSNIALLENHKVLDKNARLDVKIDEGFRILSSSDGWVLSSNIDGILIIKYVGDKSMTQKFELKKTIATASIKDNLIAVLFADNEMAIYSISTKELLFKEKGNAQKVIDSRVVKPYFMDDLVLFSTLDGKVVIVNTKLKKRLRTAIVSSEDNFNNIIYLNIVNSKIIAASGHKILSLSQKEVRAKYDIRDVVDLDNNIYITTKQGELISLTSDLQLNAKLKFPFAHFLGVITYNDKLYLLEKNGYIIEVSKDLLTYKVYEVDIDDGYTFIANNKFYIKDRIITIE